MFWARIPPPRNFAKIHARGGRGLQRSQPKDLSPPWGHSGTRRRGAAAVPEPGGRGAKAAVSLGWPGAGRAFAGAYCAGRRGRRGGGRFRGGGAGAFFPVGKKPGRGGAWPRGAHKGRTLGAAARGGHGYRAAGRGRYTAAFRGGRGEGRQYTAGGARIAGRPAFSGARRAARKKRCARRGLCRVTAYRRDQRQRRGRKSPFSPYKEVLFTGARPLSIKSCFAPETLVLRSGCFFGGSE